MKRTTLSLLVLVLTMGCGEQPLSVSEETVPDGALSGAIVRSQDDYVTTPAGRYHRSCVHEIPDGARVSKSRRVERSDGTSYQIPACSYPVYRNRPDPTPRGIEPLPPTTNGWVEYAYDALSQGDQYRKLEAYWTVPAAPTGSYSGQQLYYSFPGLQSDEPAIIQPVIQYGYNGDFGGSYWSMASWICNGDCIHTTPYTNVSAGDSIKGTVSVLYCANGECEWWITIRDLTKSAWRTLEVTDTDNYYWATGGAVEVYGLTSCGQYPIDGISYSGIKLWDQNLSQLSPVWSEVINSVDPSCEFDVATTATTVDLFHNLLHLSVTIEGPSTAPQYSWVQVTANVSNAIGQVTYAWTVNGSSACGNSSTCSAQLGQSGSYTTFAVTVTDSEEEAWDSHVVFAEWDECPECAGPVRRR